MDLTGIAYSTTDVTSVGVIVITALAAIWGVRKAISFAGRG
ncbi:hypothetical protein [Sulfurimonas sp. SWIR-19]|nr:hypothetical protein [Sulfurimonas sp. SWIR-19]